MRINNNLMAMNTHRQLGINNAAGAKSIEKLSSGYRINRAGDDAAGLAISEKMRAQIRGLNQASRNAQDSISLIQTAEGAMNETHAILQRMRELGVQAANDTNVTVDREQIQKEMNQLTTEINRIGNTTEFNTMKLLNGDKAITSSTSNNLVTASSSATKAVGSYTIAFTDGVSSGSTLSAIPTFNGTNAIAIDNTEPNWNLVGGGTAVVTITKNTDGQLDISMKLTNSSNATVMTVEDTIAANADGTYSYNANGVSFTMTAADYAGMGTAGANTKLTLTVTSTEITAGSKATLNDWTTNTIATASYTRAAFSGSITVSSAVDTRVRSLVISGTTTGNQYSTGGTVKVYLKDSAGATVSEDVYTWSAGGNVNSGSDVLDYNNHGVSFKLDLNKFDTIEISKSFTTSTSATAAVYSSSTTTDSTGTLKFQIGSNENQSMQLDINDMRSKSLGISATAAGSGFVSTANISDGTSETKTEFGLDISSHSAAASAVTQINSAINTISVERAKLGAVQNRLEHTIKNLDTAAENLQASESRIRDVDMAKEMMNFTKNNILQQAAQAMLAQANQAPQGVLQLLR